ncbi:MAG TPA: hypothetical protein VKA54_05410 [Gemmatimonadaceae bacterium]|nr:hypothetical protein [Gemmatimonadaceae bacterium]
MDQTTMIAVVVGVLVLALLGWYVWQRQRSEALRTRYGPEYERTVTQVGDKRRAESELVKRQERVAQLDISPLSAEQRNGYMQQWRAVQARFVDDPKGAVTDADRLVEDVMKTRGYPISDFDQRAADLSVHHPRVVDNYRAARDIAHRHRRGEATTEDLRQAMVHYRGLFEDLLEDREHEERKEFVARSGNGERVIERSAERDDDRMEIPVKRAGERVGERDIRNDREVRP